MAQLASRMKVKASSVVKACYLEIWERLSKELYSHLCEYSFNGVLKETNHSRKINQAPLALFFFTKRQSQRGGLWHYAPPPLPPKYAPETSTFLLKFRIKCVVCFLTGSINWFCLNQLRHRSTNYVAKYLQL